VQLVTKGGTIVAVKQPFDLALQKDTAGILENKTILRFTHARESGAGIESHLNYLNRSLLERNAMKVIHMYLPDEYPNENREEYIGKGSLIKVPLKEHRPDSNPANSSGLKKMIGQYSANHYFLQFKNFYDKVKYVNYKLQLLVSGPSKKKLYMTQFREAQDIIPTTQNIIANNNIDLIVNHFVGGIDSLHLMDLANKNRIPVLAVNHFNNDWYNFIPIREQLSYVHAAAGVSAVKVPHYLQPKYINLSNGIDTRFFDPENVHLHQESPIDKPVLLLPARVVREKGHLDLLRAVIKLKTQGLNCQVVFVGKADSEDYKQELDSLIGFYGIGNDVHFIGEVDSETLRRWYALSTVVVLPSYHEGTGRVLLEAQSMGIAPVAYNAGGVSESMLHNETGFLVRRGDIGNLYKRIAQLLINEQQRISMGRNGRGFIKRKFSLSSLTQRHEQAYLKIMQQYNAEQKSQPPNQ